MAKEKVTELGAKNQELLAYLKVNACTKSREEMAKELGRELSGFNQAVSGLRGIFKNIGPAALKAFNSFCPPGKRGGRSASVKVNGAAALSALGIDLSEFEDDTDSEDSEDSDDTDTPME